MNVHLEGVGAARRRWVVVTTSIATLVSMIDQSVINTALPTIAGELHVSAAASIWAINSYQLALAVAIVPLSAAGDILGYARVFRAGLALFVIASVAAASSHSLVALAAARALAGVASAAVTVTAAPINRLSYPPSMLGTATGYAAMAVALGAAAGPIVAGGVLAIAAWPWIFAAYVPIALVIFVLSLRVIPRFPGQRERFDWWSAALSMVALGLIVIAFDDLGHGASLTPALAELAVGIGLGVVFVRRQLGAPVPMLAVDLFAQLKFSLTVFACYASFVSQMIAYVALPFELQRLMGRTPLEIGLLMLPWLLAAGALAPVAGRLADRYNSSRLAAIGLAIFALGLAALALMPSDAASLDVAWRTFVAGLGYGIFQSPNNRSIQGSAPRERSGAAQAIQAVARLVGQVSGAVIVAMIFGFAGAHGERDVSRGAIELALWIAAGFSALAALGSVWRGALTGAIRLAKAS